MLMIDLNKIGTERQNNKTMNLDQMTPLEIVTCMNTDDLNTVRAVHKALHEIAEAVKVCTACLKNGGRMIYTGAGTSGRIGLMDAVECMPTFSSDQVIGLIAGGDRAFVKAVEGAEDSEELAVQDLKNINANEKDVIIGLAASGRTPYVIGSLKYARQIHASTITIACSRNARISEYADVAVEVDAGPEVLTGSTRLKSGTCQKMICNMLTTASMVGIGKVYGNLMVDMMATNEKLRARAKHIIALATGVDEREAADALETAGGDMKTAIVMILKGVSREEASEALKESDEFVRKALEK